ncbi:MAG: hypothetical protein BGO07_00745 [Alphaproteobacteria bacterium 40-19]|nr:MAG: hypothetical protein BGO07_00745 [Alphaproteobacteria bacterium 40-19]
MKVNYFGVLNFVHHWMKNDGNRAAIAPVHFIVTSSVNVLWAPPGGSAYRASKAAISKAFEGLSASLYKRAQFSSIYCGPGLTKGLKGSLPLRWPTAKMAKYLADFAEGKKKRKYPSVFYYFVCHLLKRLPYGWISKWFGPR